jgi:NitT/TauT family transport system substrate-binding protein
VHALFFLPQYIALANGYFRDEGLDVEVSTAQGADRAMPALLTGNADIILVGPESPIYVKNGESPEKVKIFCALTGTDGLFLGSRRKLERFDWKMLKGREIMGWRPGSTPQLFLEYVIKQHGLDPAKDMTVITNLAIPARGGAWMSGRGDFAIFNEPEISQLERSGAIHVVASVGKEVGRADYTAYVATDSYIRKNPHVIQAWTNAIYRAQKWVARAQAAAASRLVGSYFPGVPVEVIEGVITRFRSYGAPYWATDPLVDPKGIDKIQEIMVAGTVLKPEQRVRYEDIVVTSFARKAMETVK